MNRGWSGLSLKNLADLADRRIDAGIRVQENIFSQIFSMIRSRVHELASLLHQEEEQLHRDTLQLEDATCASQFVSQRGSRSNRPQT